AARVHLAAAFEIERRRSGDDAGPTVALLDARIRLHGGDVAGAIAVTRSIRARQAEDRARGQTEPQRVPSEDVLCAAVELAARGAPETEWRALEERSRVCSVGQERIEVIELRALSLARLGHGAEACACLDRALSLSRSIPNAL